MARGSERWAKKLSGDSRKQRYDAQKPQMVRLEKEATEQLVKIENQVKEFAQGQSILHLPYYLTFAKELYRLNRTFTAQTLVNEAEILEEKWRARGLDYSLLDKIKVFYIQAYKIVEYFKLDISLLDGGHILS